MGRVRRDGTDSRTSSCFRDAFGQQAGAELERDAEPVWVGGRRAGDIDLACRRVLLRPSCLASARPTKTGVCRSGADNPLPAGDPCGGNLISMGGEQRNTGLPAGRKFLRVKPRA